MGAIGIVRRAPSAKGAVALGIAAATLLVLLKLAAAGTDGAPLGWGQPGAQAAATSGQAPVSYGNLPLAFVPNAGQTDSRVRYQAQAGGTAFYFTASEAVIVLAGERKAHVLRLGFVGANPRPSIEGERLAAGRVNYLVGSDAAQSRTNLPTYGGVVYHALWPGIDLAFRGERGALKYEFRVAPEANPRDIRLAYRGAGRLSLDRAGSLVIPTSLGPLSDSRPLSYQRIGGRRVAVESRYALGGASYGFAVGPYDRTRPLVVDPGLVYSTYLGGSSSDRGYDIAVDAAGSAYVTGVAQSTNFPTTAGAFDASVGGLSDTFVTKLSPTGSDLVYSTYLGGRLADGDQLHAIAVDAAGSAYVTGHTVSPDFPTTPGAFDTSFNGGDDVFVTKLNADGSALLYSTYLGGSSSDRGFDIAVDAAGSAYVTGFAQSANFPTTAGAYDRTVNGFLDVFVTKLSADGSALVYSSYVGGSSGDQARGIAVDSAGTAYVTGFTESVNFPTTTGAFDTSFNGDVDTFVTKLDPAGSTLLYSTHLGGSRGDLGNGIAVDGGGSAYVAGGTFSVNFPVTPGAFDTSGGPLDAFVTKLNPVGSALEYSTYLGGAAGDNALAIAVDARDNAYVGGFTASNDFPTTADGFDTSANGQTDAIVTKLNAAGSALLYSTYLGGAAADSANAIAIDAGGGAYVTGETNSVSFPTTEGAFDRSLASQDAFVAKLSTGAPRPASVTLSPPMDTNPVGTSHAVTATVLDAGGNALEDVLVRLSVSGSVTVSGSCTTDANGQCGFAYQGPEFPGADLISAFADTDADGIQDDGEPAAEATKSWVVPTSTPGHASAGGNIEVGGDRIAFGFHARSGDNGARGSCNVVDHAADVVVKCTNVTSFVISDNAVTVFGEALVNGVATTYRIDAVDNASRGRGADTFSIQTASGYSRSGVLSGGNVRVG